MDDLSTDDLLNFLSAPVAPGVPARSLSGASDDLLMSSDFPAPTFGSEAALFGFDNDMLFDTADGEAQPGSSGFEDYDLLLGDGFPSPRHSNSMQSPVTAPKPLPAGPPPAAAAAAAGDAARNPRECPLCGKGMTKRHKLPLGVQALPTDAVAGMLYPRVAACEACCKFTQRHFADHAAVRGAHKRCKSGATPTPRCAKKLQLFKTRGWLLSKAPPAASHTATQATSATSAVTVTKCPTVSLPVAQPVAPVRSSSIDSDVSDSAASSASSAASATVVAVPTNPFRGAPTSPTVPAPPVLPVVTSRTAFRARRRHSEAACGAGAGAGAGGDVVMTADAGSPPTAAMSHKRRPSSPASVSSRSSCVTNSSRSTAGSKRSRHSIVMPCVPRAAPYEIRVRCGSGMVMGDRTVRISEGSLPGLCARSAVRASRTHAPAASVASFVSPSSHNRSAPAASAAGAPVVQSLVMTFGVQEGFEGTEEEGGSGGEGGGGGGDQDGDASGEDDEDAAIAAARLGAGSQAASSSSGAGPAVTEAERARARGRARARRGRGPSVTITDFWTSCKTRGGEVTEREVSFDLPETLPVSLQPGDRVRVLVQPQPARPDESDAMAEFYLVGVDTSSRRRPQTVRVTVDEYKQLQRMGQLLQQVMQAAEQSGGYSAASLLSDCRASLSGGDGGSQDTGSGGVSDGAQHGGSQQPAVLCMLQQLRVAGTTGAQAGEAGAKARSHAREVLLSLSPREVAKGLLVLQKRVDEVRQALRSPTVVQRVKGMVEAEVRGTCHTPNNNNDDNDDNGSTRDDSDKQSTVGGSHRGAAHATTTQRRVWDECCTADGYRLAHFAASVGCGVVVQQLKDLGADMRAVSDDGTPAEVARMYGQAQVVALLQHDANALLMMGDVDVDADAYASDATTGSSRLSRSSGSDVDSGYGTDVSTSDSPVQYRSPGKARQLEPGIPRPLPDRLLDELLAKVGANGAGPSGSGRGAGAASHAALWDAGAAEHVMRQFAAGMGSGAGASPAGAPVHGTGASGDGGAVAALVRKAHDGNELSQKDEDTMWQLLAKGLRDGHAVVGWGAGEEPSGGLGDETNVPVSIYTDADDLAQSASHKSCSCWKPGRVDVQAAGLDGGLAGADGGDPPCSAADDGVGGFHISELPSVDAGTGQRGAAAARTPVCAGARAPISVLVVTPDLRNTTLDIKSELRYVRGGQALKGAQLPSLSDVPATRSARVDHLQCGSSAAFVAHMVAACSPTTADDGAQALTLAKPAPDMLHVAGHADAALGVQFGDQDFLSPPQLAVAVGAYQHASAGAIQCVFLNTCHGTGREEDADNGSSVRVLRSDVGRGLLSRLSGVRFWITHDGYLSDGDAKAMARAFYKALRSVDNDYSSAFGLAVASTNLVGYTLHDGKLVPCALPCAASLRLAAFATELTAAGSEPVSGLCDAAAAAITDTASRQANPDAGSTGDSALLAAASSTACCQAKVAAVAAVAGATRDAATAARTGDGVAGSTLVSTAGERGARKHAATKTSDATVDSAMTPASPNYNAGTDNGAANGRGLPSMGRRRCGVLPLAGEDGARAGAAGITRGGETAAVCRADAAQDPVAALAVAVVADQVDNGGGDCHGTLPTGREESAFGVGVAVSADSAPDAPLGVAAGRLGTHNTDAGLARCQVSESTGVGMVATLRGSRVPAKARRKRRELRRRVAGEVGVQGDVTVADVTHPNVVSASAAVANIASAAVTATPAQSACSASHDVQEPARWSARGLVRLLLLAVCVGGLLLVGAVVGAAGFVGGGGGESRWTGMGSADGRFDISDTVAMWRGHGHTVPVSLHGGGASGNLGRGGERHRAATLTGHDLRLGYLDTVLKSSTTTLGAAGSARRSALDTTDALMRGASGAVALNAAALGLNGGAENGAAKHDARVGSVRVSGRSNVVAGHGSIQRPIATTARRPFSTSAPHVQSTMPQGPMLRVRRKSQQVQLLTASQQHVALEPGQLATHAGGARTANQRDSHSQNGRHVAGGSLQILAAGLPSSASPVPLTHTPTSGGAGRQAGAAGADIQLVSSRLKPQAALHRGPQAPQTGRGPRQDAESVAQAAAVQLSPMQPVIQPQPQRADVARRPTLGVVQTGGVAASCLERPQSVRLPSQAVQQSTQAVPAAALSASRQGQPEHALPSRASPAAFLVLPTLTSRATRPTVTSAQSGDSASLQSVAAQVSRHPQHTQPAHFDGGRQGALVLLAPVRTVVTPSLRVPRSGPLVELPRTGGQVAAGVVDSADQETLAGQIPGRVTWAVVVLTVAIAVGGVAAFGFQAAAVLAALVAIAVGGVAAGAVFGFQAAAVLAALMHVAGAFVPATAAPAPAPARGVVAPTGAAANPEGAPDIVPGDALRGCARSQGGVAETGPSDTAQALRDAAPSSGPRDGPHDGAVRALTLVPVSEEDAEAM